MKFSFLDFYFSYCFIAKLLSFAFKFLIFINQ
nr:MAG TPA: hypothetical protein [Caudoviricetes sp.]